MNWRRPSSLPSALSTTQIRAVFFVAIILTLLPAGWSVLTYGSVVASGAAGGVTGNVTFISTQGTFSSGQGAGISAIEKRSNKEVWSFPDCPAKCYDVDPLGNDTVLFVSKISSSETFEANNSNAYSWKATKMNWRTGEILERFSVPPDTHDVDYIGNGSYIVANKVSNENAEQRWLREAKSHGWVDENRTHDSDLIYIYNAKTDDITWEYDFRNHYPPTAGNGVANDYTHVNDVDFVKNGSAILANPSNLDRVVLINRSTKRTEWVLGEQDNHTILNEPRNPTLLSTDPATVLVADSENDRVIEYRKDGDRWIQTWVYSGNLDWPRDADRLPNGNTLIVDSGSDRVLEVTPRRTVEWETNTNRHPHDAERLQYGDEPQGPPMQTILARNSRATTSKKKGGVVTTIYYGLSGWVLPPWTRHQSFVGLSLAALALLGWGEFEIYRWQHDCRA